MAYSYENEKAVLFTDRGQRYFLKVRDHVRELLEEAGAFRMDRAFGEGDSWELMACVDRLVELEEIREVTQPSTPWAQNRIFTFR